MRDEVTNQVIRQEMQKLLDTGKVKNIGVSNFQISHLEKLLNDPSCKVVPSVNQIEVRFYHLTATT
jgi:glycerol 2-dehydrogenase (NADP+)